MKKQYEVYAIADVMDLDATITKEVFETIEEAVARTMELKDTVETGYTLKCVAINIDWYSLTPNEKLKTVQSQTIMKFKNWNK